MANIIDKQQEEDTNALTSLIQANSANILQLLQMTVGDSVFYDPSIITANAKRSLEVMQETIETVLNDVFPIHKIIEVIIAIIFIALVVLAIVIAIRIICTRRKLIRGKKIFNRLDALLKIDYTTNIAAQRTDLMHNHNDDNIV